MSFFITNHSKYRRILTSILVIIGSFNTKYTKNSSFMIRKRDKPTLFLILSIHTFSKQKIEKEYNDKRTSDDENGAESIKRSTNVNIEHVQYYTLSSQTVKRRD